MGQIGNTEMYLIWEKFGITVMSSGLIDITGSSLKTNIFKQKAITQFSSFKFQNCDNSIFYYYYN